MLHHIQQAILDRLATSETLRYGALKPSELDGNVFGYHLKALMRDRYVTKRDDGSYQLTSIGKDYIVNRYEDPLHQAHSIFLLAVTHGDQWLMRERRVQPLLGMTGFVHGEPVAGEDVLVTAQRRLFDKTGIDIPLSLHSSGLIMISRSGTIESYSHALIITGETNQGITTPHDATGRNFWRATAELESDMTLPSCGDIAARVTSGDQQPFDWRYSL